MSEQPDLTERDFTCALQEMGTYIDVLPGDLVTLYRLACKHAELRETECARVSDIMTHDVISVAPDASVAYAAELLLQHHVRNLPVVQRDGGVVGMLTEDDVLAAVGLPCHHPVGRWWCKLNRLFSHRHRVDGLKGLVRDSMSTDPVKVLESATLEQVVERMKRNRASAVIVTDERERLRGIVTRTNLVRAFVQHDEVSDAHLAC